MNSRNDTDREVDHEGVDWIGHNSEDTTDGSDY